MRAWLAAAYWRLLIALQLKKDAVVLYKNLAEKASLDLRASTLVACSIVCKTCEDLGNISKMQADERIIPDITGLDVPLVMGSRLREPIKAIQGTAKVFWDKEREGAVEDEDVPLTAEKLKRLEILLYRRHRPRIPVDKDADGTAVMSPEGAYSRMHRVRCERAQINRDVSPGKLVQNDGASARDLRWFTQNGVETAEICSI